MGFFYGQRLLQLCGFTIFGPRCVHNGSDEPASCFDSFWNPLESVMLLCDGTSPLGWLAFCAEDNYSWENLRLTMCSEYCYNRRIIMLVCSGMPPVRLSCLGCYEICQRGARYDRAADRLSFWICFGTCLLSIGFVDVYIGMSKKLTDLCIHSFCFDYRFLDQEAKQQHGSWKIV